MRVTSNFLTKGVIWSMVADTLPFTVDLDLFLTPIARLYALNAQQRHYIAK